MANRAQTFTVGTTKYDLFSNKLVIKPGTNAPITIVVNPQELSAVPERIGDFYRVYTNKMSHGYNTLVLMNTDKKNGNGKYILKVKSYLTDPDTVEFKQEIPENVYNAIVQTLDAYIDATHRHNWLNSNYNNSSNNNNSSINSNENTSFRSPASGGRRRKTMKRRVHKKKHTYRRR